MIIWFCFFNANSSVNFWVIYNMLKASETSLVWTIYVPFLLYFNFKCSKCLPSCWWQILARLMGLSVTFHSVSFQISPTKFSSLPQFWVPLVYSVFPSEPLPLPLPRSKNPVGLDQDSLQSRRNISSLKLLFLEIYSGGSQTIICWVDSDPVLLKLM